MICLHCVHCLQIAGWLPDDGKHQGFGAFSQAVNKFEEIPKEFTMTVAPTQVTASINGAEILAQIMPEIQSEILSQTSFKIEEFRQQLKSGDV